MNFDYLLDERYEEPQGRDLIVKPGTILFHGTMEEFEPEKLSGGGYDQLI